MELTVGAVLRFAECMRRSIANADSVLSSAPLRTKNQCQALKWCHYQYRVSCGRLLLNN
jgi:hypothetical protein